jgi:hypothetical protein
MMSLDSDMVLCGVDICVGLFETSWYELGMEIEACKGRSPYEPLLSASSSSATSLRLRRGHL